MSAKKLSKELSKILTHLTFLTSKREPLDVTQYKSAVANQDRS